MARKIKTVFTDASKNKNSSRNILIASIIVLLILAVLFYLYLT